MAKYLAMASCSEKQKACVGWINKYFDDCVCNLSGEISFGLGMISLFCWGMAEIPQLITNFQTKSGHGVSLALLLTWVIGDVFNLVGCLLEPVTLPTQFYTALTLYYDYGLRWWKSICFDAPLEEEDNGQPLNPKVEDLSRPIPTTAVANASRRTDVYYTSARSLASSGTPSCGGTSYLGVRSGPSEGLAFHDSSSEDEGSPAHHHGAAARKKTTFSRSVSYGTFVAGFIGLPYQTKAFREMTIISSERRTLQDSEVKSLEGNFYGLLLGWIMAAIYMGGRLPQIYLNMKRGSVEGLNPLMFMFALAANATYVGSILVRSVEWEKVGPNAPWLLDAIVCILLDLLIMLQFAYYKFLRGRDACTEDEHEGFTHERRKILV
nr:PREDICTED: probable vacuolar amino acid transporter YPQ1 isoform X2 [Musa acuminata subsp. malaccensis]